jgi:hypothetical protein
MTFQEIGSGDIGHNGSRDPDNLLAHDAFQNMFISRPVASALEKFTEPGKTTLELLMRTRFVSENQMTDLIILAWLSSHFNCPELDNLILKKLAGLVSVPPIERMQMVKEAVMGRPDTSVNDHKLGGFLRKAMGGKRNDNGD